MDLTTLSIGDIEGYAVIETGYFPPRCKVKIDAAFHPIATLEMPDGSRIVFLVRGLEFDAAIVDENGCKRLFYIQDERNLNE